MLSLPRTRSIDSRLAANQNTIRSKIATPMTLRVISVGWTRSRRVSHVCCRSNTDRIDASQQNVAMCQKRTCAGSALELVTVR